MSKFWKFIKNEATEKSPENVELRIDGIITDDDDTWIYEWLEMQCASPNTFREELNKYKGQNMDIVVWIDSCGGDVFAAAGIYNALKEYDGKITVKIDGKAMSAASVIAMAGDEILMSPVAIMMIHNPLSAVQGYASDMRKTADVLDTIKESIINAYQSKTNKSRSKISSMMDDETYMDAKTAIKNGFADGMLYQKNQAEPQNIMNFSFNRLSIQNCANATVKHLIQIEDETKTNKTVIIQNDKEETIVDLKELKEKYPDIYKNAYNEGLEAGKEEGIKNERERIKGIDEISAHADPKIINKAKYEKPMDAKDLAMEIVKADNVNGQRYLDNLNKDAAASNTDEVPPALDKTDDSPENNDNTKIKNAAGKIASYFKRSVR